MSWNAGDILSLVEKAEQNIKGADAERMAKRMMAAKFDFNDFMEQSRMMNQMGSMGAMMKMMPGAFDLQRLPERRHRRHAKGTLPDFCPPLMVVTNGSYV